MGWPSNTLLYVGVTPASTVTADAVAARFGTLLTLGSLSQEQWGQTVGEMAGAGLPDADLALALAWAAPRGLSVRTAAQYVQRFRQ